MNSTEQITRIAKIQLLSPDIGKYLEQPELIQATLEEALVVYFKSKQTPALDLAILLSFFTCEIKTYVHRKTLTRMLLSASEASEVSIVIKLEFNDRKIIVVNLWL